MVRIKNTENVYVFGSFPGWDLSVNQLQRLLQTDIWYVTFRTNKSFISTGEGTNKASVLKISMDMQYSSRFLQIIIHLGELKHILFIVRF